MLRHSFALANPGARSAEGEPRSQEEAALQELLAALYKGDTAAAESRITPPKEVLPGKAFADYVAAFRASLVQAAELEVEGYFPLPGRDCDLFFVPRWQRYRTGSSPCVPEQTDVSRFDETKAPRQGGFGAQFSVSRLERYEAGSGGICREAVTPYRGCRTGREPYSQSKPHQREPGQDGYAQAADPALQFYKSCLTVPDRQSLDHYFRCFEGDAQSRLRGEFAKMPDDKQEQLFAMTSASRHVDFVVENPSSWIVYYHSNVYAVSSRDWIQRTSGGEFVLLNPLVFFPLDDLLSSPEIHAAIAAAVGLGRRTSRIGSQGKVKMKCSWCSWVAPQG